ncbi:hypothetical protein HOF92_01015 [bacterium]|nr:hypothetical protein [bacterium]
MRLRKQTSCFTIFVFLLQLLAPVWIYSQEQSEPSKSQQVLSYVSEFPAKIFRNFKGYEKNLTPEKLEEIISNSDSETYKGDPTLRAEQSSILRPIKQVALRVLDGEVGIVKTFLSFEATGFLKRTLTHSKARMTLARTRQGINLMNPRQLAGIDRALNSLEIPRAMRKFMRKMGPGIAGFVKSESKFAMMGVIGALLSMGIYDGLDLSTTKDKVLALDPLTMNTTVSHGFLPGLLSSMATRQMFEFFNQRFDVFYDKMLSSTSFGSKILKSLESKAEIIGNKIFKASRIGFTKPEGESLAKQLGLVGIGEGSKFALKDLLRTISVGLAFGLVANLVVDSVAVGARGYADSAVVGGNRNKRTIRPEYNAYLFQRTGDRLKDSLNERKFALKDLYEGYQKNPITRVVSTVSGFTGAYFGSVLAGAVLVSGGLPTMIGGVMIASLFGGVGSFVGKWATTKFERSPGMKNFRRELVEKRLVKVLRKMDVSSREGWSPSEISKVAQERSWDMHKRESLGQTYSRMYLVEDFSHVNLYESGAYVYMSIAKEFGEKFDMQAHIRYDLVDLQGNRGIWDILTNKIYSIGNIQGNNGLRVIFVTDDQTLGIKGNTIESKEGTDFRVLSNGLVMTKSDHDQEKWVIKGQNINTDLFLRERKERFSWDGQVKAYQRVGGVPLAPREDPLKALLDTFPSAQEAEGEERVFQKVWEMIRRSGKQAREQIEELPTHGEEAYFQSLEEYGASRALIKKLEDLGSPEWKTMLIGKIFRGTSHRQISFLRALQGKDLQDIKNSLESELETPHTRTMWDKLRILINPSSLSAQFLR